MTHETGNMKMNNVFVSSFTEYFSIVIYHVDVELHLCQSGCNLLLSEVLSERVKKR